MKAGNCKRKGSELRGNAFGLSYAGSTRVFINLRKMHFVKKMDCQVEPDNDEPYRVGTGLSPR